MWLDVIAQHDDELTAHRELRLPARDLGAAGMVDGITALNTGMQTLQREQALDRVKLGLVEQQAKANTPFIEKAQSFDAFMAGHEERLKALEQTARDVAARRQPP